MIDSKFADMKNTGGALGRLDHRRATSASASSDKTPWAHLDIAGTGFGSPQNDINKSWGSGWGVRLLDQLVADHYEVAADDRNSVLSPATPAARSACCRSFWRSRCERGWRVVVQAASEERIDALDAHLWTYRDDGFLPHGTWREQRGGDAADPLTTADDNPNGARCAS